MSGIAGAVNCNLSYNQQIQVLQNMQQALAHRGANQDKLYTNSKAFLLSSLNTPNHFYKYVITYDGTIYNAKELRAELMLLGHKFSMNSDTELLIHAYVEWKENCIQKLNGIFAFAILEESTNRLFFARDRIGVKPFFYTSANGTFVFASEIKAVMKHPLIKPEIDQQTIAEIMFIGPGRTPGCGVFKGIDELPPGYCGFFEEGSIRFHRYWHLEDKPHTDTFEETVQKVRTLLFDAIDRQLTANEPVGTFLSGGLDSSIITAIVSEQIPNLQTFSVDYKDNDKYFKANHFQPGDDRPYIDEMVTFLGKKNQISHERILLDTEELAGSLYDAVDARDLPGMGDIDSSLLLFCKKVKKHVSVVLSGECADEIFGGYPWYRDKDIREYEGFPWSRSLEYRKSFLQPDVLNGAKDALQYVNERYKDTIADTHVLSKATPLERRMKEMVNLNFSWFMQTLLDRKDRMTSSCGLKARVPFCDYRIAEYLYTVPWSIKDYEGREKGLLRHAMEGVLPKNVLWRKKSPYPKTHNPAYFAAVSAMLNEVMSDINAPIFQFIRKEALAQLLSNKNTTHWYGQLMAAPQTIAYFLQFNYWLKKWF